MVYTFKKCIFMRNYRFYSALLASTRATQTLTGKEVSVLQLVHIAVLVLYVAMCVRACTYLCLLFRASSISVCTYSHVLCVAACISSYISVYTD